MTFRALLNSLFQPSFQKALVAYEEQGHVCLKKGDVLSAIEMFSRGLSLKYSKARAKFLWSLVCQDSADKFSYSVLSSHETETVALEGILQLSPLEAQAPILRRLKFIYETGKSSSRDLESLPNLVRANEIRQRLERISQKTKKKNSIEIVIITDDVYAAHAGVTLTSALYYSLPSTFYSFHILTAKDKLSAENQKKFLELKAIKDCNIQFHFFEEGLIPQEAYEVLKKGNYPILIAYRLFFEGFFKKFSKIISLDADLIVKSDLTALWKENVSGACILAATDPLPEIGKISLGLPIEALYMNCGVMVMNLQRMRDLNFSQKSLETLKIHHKKITLLEQDVMNLTFQQEIKLIHPSWNTPIRALFHQKYLNFRVDPFWPKILHFILIRKKSTEKRVKPWKFPVGAEAMWKHEPTKIPFYFREYWAFRDLSPWTVDKLHP